MNNWKLICKNEHTVIYKKGDREFSIIVFYNLAEETVSIAIDKWISNGTEVDVPDDNPARYSAKYGDTRTFAPTLPVSVYEWINQKGKEIFQEARKKREEEESN